MKKKISASIWKYMLLPCFLNLLYFTALAASISFKDITFIKLICYAFGYGVITFCLCIGYQKIYSGDTYTLMLRHIVNLASINVFIMVLFILYPSAIDFFDQFLNMDQMYKLAFAPRGMVRAYGISSFGGATLSVFYAILLMLHYRFLKSVNGKALVVGVLKTALLFLGICLSGRTGFVVLLFFLISDLIRRSWLFVRLKMP
ncbi:MAG: hypothetical protein U9Q67_02815, partial [Patescibacteria group bacterium]|nr:hypothetical protein [Patescibacteria group bacterium]